MYGKNKRPPLLEELRPSAPTNLPCTPTVPPAQFRELSEPEPSFPIQVDTPQPYIPSSPRQVIDPTAMWILAPFGDLSHLQLIPFVPVPDLEGTSSTYSPVPSAGSALRPRSSNLLQVFDRPPSGRPFSSGQIARPLSSTFQAPEYCTMLPPMRSEARKTPKAKDKLYKTPDRVKQTPRKRALRTPVREPKSVESSKRGPRKSRGCWTCKCRRKKCDEQQPMCQMCSKLSLPCYGFSPEKPQCMDSPEKTEATRNYLTELTKSKRWCVRQPNLPLEERGPLAFGDYDP